eukprot:90666-Prorocentrum_minimum.AAC.1
MGELTSRGTRWLNKVLAVNSTVSVSSPTTETSGPVGGMAHGLACLRAFALRVYGKDAKNGYMRRFAFHEPSQGREEPVETVATFFS